MANRQYVGARYVPKFYQGSNGNEWDSGVVYEALTMVTYLNNTYCSRKPVPARTVAPNLDTDYWVLTSAYSSQVAELREEVSALDDIYTRLNGKKIIVLGDSLTIGSGEALNNTWVEQLATRYNATTYNYGVSGSPVAGTDSDSMISRLPSILSAHDECDIFVLMGGANDKNRNIPLGSINSTSNTDFIGAIKNICATVQGKYKEKCKMICMTTYHRYDDVNTLGYREYDYVDAMLRACAIYSIPCFNNYNDCGISLAERSGSTYNNWADIGFTGGGSTRNYHFSKKAYEFLTPIYASFLANCNAQSSSQSLKTYTSGNDVWTKTNLGNGLSMITLRRAFTEQNVTDLGNHIALGYSFNINIPVDFRVSDCLCIESSVTLTSGSAISAIPNHSTFTNITSVEVRPIIIYGSTAPSDISGVVNLKMIGFNL